jgi:DNA-binding PadR family transcriptional regulator
MTSLVNWSLLGLVIERPSYGFELGNRFERVYGDLCELKSGSQIYSALNALETRGFIATITAGEFARQPKPHYGATPLGVSSYEGWLVEQAGADDRRQELWVRQLGVLVHDPEAALRVIDSWEREHLKASARIGHVAGAQLVEELVAERRRLAVGTTIAWLQHARSRFEALAASRRR